MECKVCGNDYNVTDTVSDKIDICPACGKDNLENLIVKCKACKTVTHIHKGSYDRADFIEQLYRRDIIDDDDVRFTGVGLIVYTRECPQCTEVLKTFNN